MVKERKVDYLFLKNNSVYTHDSLHNEKLLFTFDGKIREWKLYATLKDKTGILVENVVRANTYPYMDALIEWPLSNWYEKDGEKIEYTPEIIQLFLLVEENGKDVLYKSMSFDGKMFSDLEKIIEADSVNFKISKSRRGIYYLNIEYIKDEEEKNKVDVI